MYGDSPDGSGSTINAKLILWMRLEKDEVTWSEIRFESKGEAHQGFIDCVQRLLSD